jgi:hypothetical protein
MNEHDSTLPPETQHDAALLQRVRRDMDRSCAALDGATQSRLNAMRHAALAQGQRKGLRLPQWLPVGGLMTACILVLAVMLQPAVVRGPASLPETAPVEDLDLLTASEDLDFYEEYEFYQWLATSNPGY